jgi:hypothetical protein
MGQQRHASAQYRQRMGVLGDVLQHLVDLLRDLAGAGQAGGELVALGTGRQLAIPQQVDDFLEAGFGRQVFDRVAAVDQAPGLSVNGANGRRGGHHAFERTAARARR